jgi:hypothetical protein
MWYLMNLKVQLIINSLPFLGKLIDPTGSITSKEVK